MEKEIKYPKGHKPLDEKREELEKGYLGGDAEERSNLKVKEVYGKMQHQFFEGVKKGMEFNKSSFQNFLEEIKRKLCSCKLSCVDYEDYSCEEVKIIDKSALKHLGKGFLPK